MDLIENIIFRTPKQKALVLQLYKDLKFVRGNEDVKIHQFDELDLVYITGYLPDAERQQEILLPLAADEAISMKKIGEVQKCLFHRHKSSRLTLALMDSDSTTVYFGVTPGLLPPSDLEGRK
ncbi:hypothetical protein DAPPUDRAFT_330607 [Daphnia pulex]|uniref:tRNA-splicing endonuclease subunit Sen15 domain-containing protein n=1 Tax=Daphnia pulex TaxID=6669 RepID=E9HK32_DAPPU|nr:hypothetical protein DAPPUDRAFT_330607 [Daphnia pulex]|eukprot:EFX67900.1 hypothetical protein DAPPUDRAFT_330607 [Daphnia pulex]